MSNKIDITNINFHYTLDVKYDVAGDGCTCPEWDYCRCTTYENVHVYDDIDLTKVTDSIYNHIFGNTNDIAIKRENTINEVLDEFNMNKYFINRLITHYRLYDPESWNVDYGHGYYGDEINGVFIDVGNQINKDLLMLFSDNKSKIEFLLTKEYRKVDTRLAHKKWDLDIIEKKDIVFGQKEHYDKVPQGLEYYSDTGYDKDLPRGILRKDGTKYRVMDGYHRMKNTREDFIIALVAT